SHWSARRADQTEPGTPEPHAGWGGLGKPTGLYTASRSSGRTLARGGNGEQSVVSISCNGDIHGSSREPVLRSSRRAVGRHHRVRSVPPGRLSGFGKPRLPRPPSRAYAG